MRIVHALAAIFSVLLLSAGSAYADDPADPFAEFDSAFEAQEEAPSEAPAQAPAEEPAAAVESAPAKVAEPEPVKQAESSDFWLDTIEVEGSLKNETAYRVGRDDQLSKVKNQVFLAQKGSITENLQFKISERAYYDAVFDFADNYSAHVREDQDHEIELRDAYVDYSAGDFDIRFGNQQIVWGEAVGLFIADVVTAKDYREFVLPDFDMIRRSEFGADIEYTRGDVHVEVVYIPFPEFNKFGVEGSEYEFSVPLPDGVPYVKLGPDEPANSAENSQYGSRVTYLVDGWDLGVFYLYTWDKTPVYFASIDPVSSLVTLTPDYRRQHIIGLTFSKDVDPVVFKGEGTLNPDASLSTSDPNDSDAVVRKTYADYSLGVDYKAWDSIDTNFQVLQRAIFNHDDELIENEDALRTLLSFWASTTYYDDRVRPEFLIVASVMRLDMMIRPSVRFTFADHWDWKLGADYFEGSTHGFNRGLFGQFDDRSRVYSELLYKF